MNLLKYLMIIATLVSSWCQGQDTIQLKSGKQLHGKVLRQNPAEALRVIQVKVADSVIAIPGNAVMCYNRGDDKYTTIQLDGMLQPALLRILDQGAMNLYQNARYVGPRESLHYTYYVVSPTKEVLYLKGKMKWRRRYKTFFRQYPSLLEQLDNKEIDFDIINVVNNINLGLYD